MRVLVALPDRTVENVGLPSSDPLFVELEEDAFSAILGRGHPGGRAVAGQRCDAVRRVVDAVEGVDAGEPDEGVDLLQPLDGDDSGHQGLQLVRDLARLRLEVVAAAVLDELRAIAQYGPLG